MKKSKRNQFKANPDSPADIIRAASKAYSIVHYNDEFFTLDSLADELGITVNTIKHHFGDKSGLLIEVLNHVQNLCQEKVFNLIEKSQYQGIKRVVYFLKLVHLLMAENPECAYWFKAYFSSDVVLTKVYPYLTKFYERWQYVVTRMLNTVIAVELSEKIATIYVDLLKACLLNDDGYAAIANLFSSKFFLFYSVRRAQRGQFV